MKALAAALALATCAAVPPVVERPASLAMIEEASGGRLGVVLLDDEGKVLLSHRDEERFAFCSSFKVALAGAAFEKARQGAIDLDASVTFSRDDFPGYQPVMEAKLDGESGTTTLREAIDATVSVSDNLAANLLIDAIGGPEEVTSFWRSWHDPVTRLDRRETALNENAAGDPRDSSSPRAMADMMRRLIDGGLLPQENADQLARLTHKATTGLDRVRAGLPEGWSAGGKTGTCKPEGQPGQQVNDVGWVRAPDGRLYWFAVMLDRPTVSGAEAKAMHARVGEIIAASLAD
ncbi:class A beta-lactamase [Sphingomicrobium clamense]|uniref:beta-lactamase n=1 Tax=Sphingomicrobium clamense TaxID=2851013 RepID=A0ABS6V6E3_9SPHN|nr:class A beta-lactamase [Sphingomicrobium sp. B8]MBW0145140.1 class A beta-lactamase [Sphingomicrobium sp. B8]